MGFHRNNKAPLHVFERPHQHPPCFIGRPATKGCERFFLTYFSSTSSLPPCVLQTGGKADQPQRQLPLRKYPTPNPASRPPRWTAYVWEKTSLLPSALPCRPLFREELTAYRPASALYHNKKRLRPSSTWDRWPRKAPSAICRKVSRPKKRPLRPPRSKSESWGRREPADPPRNPSMYIDDCTWAPRLKSPRATTPRSAPNTFRFQ